MLHFLLVLKNGAEPTAALNKHGGMEELQYVYMCTGHILNKKLNAKSLLKIGLGGLRSLLPVSRQIVSLVGKDRKESK